MKKSLFVLLLSAALSASPALANASDTLNFKTLSNPGAYGEIQGMVKNCSDQSLLEDSLIHIPGKSVATRLGSDGSFHLHFVPTGTHKLVLELNDRDIAEIQAVPVQKGNSTQINRFEVCVTERHKTLARASESPSQSIPRCPKGGFTCSSSWHNIKARKAKEQKSVSETVSQKQPTLYVVNEGYELIRVR